MPKLEIPKAPILPRKADGRSKVHSLFSGSRYLGFMQDLFQAQTDAVALSAKDLRKLEPILVTLGQVYEAGDYTRGVKLAADIKSKLGQFYLDQKPAGWVLYCEGACFLEIGDLPHAYSCFEQAFRAIDVLDARLIRLGLARASEDESLKTSNFVASYIGDPDWFLSRVESEERERVQASINAAESYRQDVMDGAEAVLMAALKDRFDQERRAFSMSQAASKHRNESHILCEADHHAGRQINQEYRKILLRWFTIPRNPNMGSYGSDPGENLDNLKSLQTTSEAEDTVSIEAIFEDMGLDQSFRYILNRTPIPLSANPVWRLEQIWSIWDDEEIQMY